MIPPCRDRAHGGILCNCKSLIANCRRFVNVSEINAHHRAARQQSAIGYADCQRIAVQTFEIERAHNRNLARACVDGEGVAFIARRDRVAQRVAGHLGRLP